MSFLMPKVPAMPAIPQPQALPEPPKYDDKERTDATAAKQAKLRSSRTGRSATILTSAQGLEDDEITTKKTLLGG